MPFVWRPDNGSRIGLLDRRNVGLTEPAFEPCHLWRWRFDPTTGAVTEEQLDEREHGFPRIDDPADRTGQPLRLGADEPTG